MTSDQAICEQCESLFIPNIVKFGGKVIFHQRKCDTCIMKYEQDELERPARERKERLESRFQLMVPPIYHRTDPNRLSGILRSYYGKSVNTPTGFGFIGTSGEGKTRVAVSMLKACHDAGKDCFYVAATDLALHSANQFAESPAIKDISTSSLRLCRVSDVLLIDDLGKAKMTDRAEAELYDILEYRTSHDLPTIWTSNSDSQGLRRMLSPDRQEAILRRLMEFSTIVKV